jgi:photosystem II stability/assembly factor-like uncharacterized protein
LPLWHFIPFLECATYAKQRISDGAVKIRRDFLLRKNTLKNGLFLQAWAIGAVIAILAPLNLLLWSKVVVARVNTEGWASASAWGQNYILHTADGGKTWARLGTTAEPLQSLTFTSRLSGWATGDQGLWHTEDGGIHWNLKLPEDWQKGHPVLVAFGSPQSGLTLWSTHSDISAIAVGPGVVLLTRDGGKDWIDVPDVFSVDFSQVVFASPTTGWILSRDRIILHSEDAGNSWTIQHPVKGETLLSMAFLKQ